MATTTELNLSENAIKILEDRYLIRDEDGNLAETPTEMFWRVANAVSQGEQSSPPYFVPDAKDPTKWNKVIVQDGVINEWSQRFYDLMTSLKFLPNSPTLVNAGRGRGSLSACFVISPEDSLESIMKVASDAAMIEKWGGGIGFGFSQLRQKGAAIKTTHGVACGPVAVMKLYSKVGETLTQGSFRLGAHMGQLSISHPDIQEFIHCKDNGTDVTNFNISVQVTDAFMNAVKNDGNWELLDPRNNKTIARLRARDLWNEIVESAWRTGDPGLAFMDRVWETAPNPQLGKIQSSNPCGEEFLENYGNCCLGSINLGKFVDFSIKGDIDWQDLAETIHTAVRFLDNVIEVNQFPLPELREMNLRTRRIGLGVMGWADMLVLMGIRYDSDEALDLAKTLGNFIRDQAEIASEILGKERGSYPEWKSTEFSPYPRRHSSVITIAPTGTISRLADCSSGIEPYFALAWWSNILWKDQHGKSTKFLDSPYPIRRRFGNADDLLERIANGTDGISKQLGEGDIYRTANDISPEWHVKMQAVWQKECVTNSTSKTINMANTATKEDVERAYMLAWELGCKGITIYRDGSRSMQVLEIGANGIEKPIGIEREATSLDKHIDEKRAKLLEETSETKRAISTNEHKVAERAMSGENTKIIERGKVKMRGEVVYGYTRQLIAPEGKINLTINSDDTGPMEVFINVGKAGSDIAASAEGLGRLLSLILRMDSTLTTQQRLEEIVHQLEKIGGSGQVGYGNGMIRSMPDAIAKGIAMHYMGLNDSLELPRLDNLGIKARLNGNLCPDCRNNTLVFEEGCEKCYSCGYARC